MTAKIKYLRMSKNDYIIDWVEAQVVPSTLPTVATARLDAAIEGIKKAA